MTSLSSGRTDVGLTAGILGGMGPYATHAFFQAVLQATPARRDWEHVRLVIDNNPHIPSRTRHFLYGEPSPFDGMLESCLRLQAYPVDFIAVPCNSAVVFLEELRPRLRVPILDIRKAAVAELIVRHPQVRRVAVLGGRVTYARRTYSALLEAEGRELVVHDEAEQGVVEETIEALKLGSAPTLALERFRNLCCQLVERRGVEAAVLACTEFALLSDLGVAMPFVDSSGALARTVVRVAKGAEVPA